MEIIMNHIFCHLITFHNLHHAESLQAVNFNMIFLKVIKLIIGIEQLLHIQMILSGF